MDVGTKILEYLNDNGIRQSHVAQKANINPSMFNQALHNKRRLPLDEFVKICKALNKLPEDFLSDFLSCDSQSTA